MGCRARLEVVALKVRPGGEGARERREIRSGTRLRPLRREPRNRGHREPNYDHNCDHRNRDDGCRPLLVSHG